jgi:hypothetical protein
MPTEQISRYVSDLQPDFPNSTYFATLGGLLGASVAAFMFFGLQRIFQHLPIFQLIDAMHGTSTTLCFAGITASSTIMPLMLTIFSFARQSKVEFNPWFYGRIKRIALLCAMAFVAGLVTLTVLSAPIGDMPEVNNAWYRVFYYAIVTGISTMVGVLLAILILLYYSILHIINQLNPHLQGERE